MKTGLLIATYNRLEAVQKCFDSLLPTMTRKDVTTFVIDDGSTDGTDEFVHNYFFRTNISSVHSTYKFSVNLLRRRVELLRNAQHMNMDYVVFLDSDIEIADPNSNWLDTLLNPMKVVPRIGITGQHGWFVNSSWWKEEAPKDHQGLVDCVSGYCLAAKREVYTLPNFLDLRYDEGGYGASEDDNACAVARASGFEVWQIPELPLRHNYAGTWKKLNGVFEKNRALYRSLWEGKGVVQFERENQ